MNGRILRDLHPPTPILPLTLSSMCSFSTFLPPSYVSLSSFCSHSACICYLPAAELCICARRMFFRRYHTSRRLLTAFYYMFLHSSSRRRVRSYQCSIGISLHSCYVLLGCLPVPSASLYFPVSLKCTHRARPRTDSILQ